MSRSSMRLPAKTPKALRYGEPVMSKRHVPVAGAVQRYQIEPSPAKGVTDGSPSWNDALARLPVTLPLGPVSHVAAWKLSLGGALAGPSDSESFPVAPPFPATAIQYVVGAGAVVKLSLLRQPPAESSSLATGVSVASDEPV